MQQTHTQMEAAVNWSGISADFYDTTKSIRSIAQAFGVSETAVRKHAKRHGWHRPSAIPHVGRRGVSHMGSALEAQLANIDSVIERSRRFVTAMVHLGAEPAKIAAAMGISERSLFAEFGGEIEIHAGRHRNAAGKTID
jgi:hypothetical protein